MQYVDYGKIGLKVSRFGLGCMRFPANATTILKSVDVNKPNIRRSCNEY